MKVCRLPRKYDTVTGYKQQGKRWIFRDFSLTIIMRSTICGRLLEIRHNASPVTPINFGGTVLKESDDIVILGVTFDSKLTFEKHLRLVSRAASQRVGILRKSSRMFHDRSLLQRYFRGFVLPVLEYCSAVWCSVTDPHLKLQDRAISWCPVPNWECV